MLRLDIPITKVDAARRLVTGVATAETADRAGEVCDYATTKPNYERWSRAIAESTEGRSLGNLRAMHGSVAAGKVTAIHFNDALKQIEICAKVVDDAEWSKVVEGVYTGFSQGGTYARRWTDETGATRYTADPHEISLVDLPCLAQARFEMVKLDGSHEWRAFRGGDAEGAEAGVAKAGRRNSAADQQRIQALHDQSVALGARCPAREESGSGDGAGGIGKNAGADAARGAGQGAGESIGAPSGVALDALLAKRFDALAASLADALAAGLAKSLDAPLASLERRLAAIEAQPMPLPLSGTRAVAREDGDVDALLADPGALSLLAIKLAQRQRR